MSWPDFLGNDRPIREIFDVDPILESVRLHEVSLHQDGPKLSLRLDLNEYPSKPPKKWRTLGFNRVQIILLLIDISNFDCRGWTTNNIVSIDVQPMIGSLHMMIKGKGFTLSSNGRFLEIEKISAYATEQYII